MKKLLLLFGLLGSVPVFAQNEPAPQQYVLNSLIGLDTTRTTFEFKKPTGLLRSGYLMNLLEDGTFTSFFSGFCGVGETAYVHGMYRWLVEDTIEFEVSHIIYKDMGKEIRREAVNRVEVYHYNAATNEINRIDFKRI